MHDNEQLDDVRDFPALPWFRLATRVASSTVDGAGLGVFSRDAASIGELIAFDLPSSQWIAPVEELNALPEDVRQYCWRLVEHVYIRGVSGGEPTPADYLNHAFEPNLIWHLGFYFAGRDIEPGDELFVDYRHLAQPDAPRPLIDTATGRPIEGMEWRRSLLAGCRELTRALEASLARDGDA